MIVTNTNYLLADNNKLKDYILELDTKDFNKKVITIEKISQIKSELSLRTLKNILEGRLFIRKADNKIILVDIIKRKYNAYDFFQKAELGIVKKRKLKKIKINNQIRNILNSKIALLELTSGNTEQKIKAIYGIINEGDPEILVIINDLLSKEKDKELIFSLNLAKNAILARFGNQTEKLRAIESLSGSTNNDIVNILRNIVGDKSLSENIRIEANNSLQDSLRNIKLNNIIKTTFFGLSLGSVLLLAAIGLAITFGVVGVINMAHGELIMLGAYCAYVVQQIIPNNSSISILIAIPTAFLFTGLVGILIERLVVKNLYGRPLETLLATFGISLILQQAVRTIFSPLNKNGKVYFLFKTSLSLASFCPKIISCLFLSSLEIKRHLSLIFSGIFKLKIFNNSSFSLLKMILFGKLELIKFNPCIEEPFSEI